jgi:hypothetical protein
LGHLSPTRLAAQIVEPKGISSTLKRPDRINGASIEEKAAAAVLHFADAVTILKWVKVTMDQFVARDIQESGNGGEFRGVQVDGAGFPGTAVTATTASKTDTVVKEVGTINKLEKAESGHDVDISIFARYHKSPLVGIARLQTRYDTYSFVQTISSGRFQPHRGGIDKCTPPQSSPAPTAVREIESPKIKMPPPPNAAAVNAHWCVTPFRTIVS